MRFNISLWVRRTQGGSEKKASAWNRRTRMATSENLVNWIRLHIIFFSAWHFYPWYRRWFPFFSPLSQLPRIFRISDDVYAAVYVRAIPAHFYCCSVTHWTCVVKRFYILFRRVKAQAEKGKEAAQVWQGKKFYEKERKLRNERMRAGENLLRLR